MFRKKYIVIFIKNDDGRVGHSFNIKAFHKRAALIKASKGFNSQELLLKYKWEVFSEYEYTRFASEQFKKKLGIKNEKYYFDLLADLQFKFERNENEIIKNILREKTEDELKDMLVTSLTESFIFLRRISNLTMEREDEFIRPFFIAAAWHLANVLHNIPRDIYSLNVTNKEEPSIKDEYILRLCEYFHYKKAFKKLAKSHFKYIHIPIDCFDTVFTPYMDVFKEG